MATTYTSTADYSCDTGYKLVGVNQRNCTAAGTWSDGEPTCQSEGQFIFGHNMYIILQDFCTLCDVLHVYVYYNLICNTYMYNSDHFLLNYYS